MTVMMKMNVSGYFPYNSSFKKIFNSTVILPSSTVTLDDPTINVNKELKIQEFATNECTCRLGHKQQPCRTTITTD